MLPEEWTTFCALARHRFGVDPQRDAPLVATRRLEEPAGEWAAVWQRFVEAPTAFPGLPDLLRQARPATQLRLFDGQPPIGRRTTKRPRTRCARP